MQIKKLEITNYKSIGRVPQIFEFENGLNLIKGSPGKGKTLIFSAIVYALFSKNSDFKSGKSVIPTNRLINDINKGDMLVILTLDNGYVIERGLKPNIFNIYKDGVNVADASSKVIDDDYIVKFCLEGLTLQEFYKTVYLSDKAVSSPFLYMSQTERKTYIENILNLRRIPILAEHLKTVISTNSLEKSSLEIELKLLNNSIDNENDNIKNLTLKQNQVKELIEQFHISKDIKTKELLDTNIILNESIETNKKILENLVKDMIDENNKQSKVLIKDANANNKVSLDNIKEKLVIDLDNNLISLNANLLDSKVVLNNKIKQIEESTSTKINTIKENSKLDKELLTTKIDYNISLMQDLKTKLDFTEVDISSALDNMYDVDLDKYNQDKSNIITNENILLDVKNTMVQLNANKSPWENTKHNYGICDNCHTKTKIVLEYDLLEHDENVRKQKEIYVRISTLNKLLVNKIAQSEQSQAQNKIMLCNRDLAINSLNDIKDKIATYENTINIYQKQLDDFDNNILKSIQEVKLSNENLLSITNEAHIVEMDNLNKTHDSIHKNLNDNYDRDVITLNSNLAASLQKIEDDNNQFIKDANNKHDVEYKTKITDVFTSIKYKQEKIESIKNEVAPLPIEISTTYLNKMIDDKTLLLENIAKNYDEGQELKIMKDIINDKEHKKKALESYLPIFEDKLNELLDRFMEDMEFSLKVTMSQDFEMLFKKNNREVSVFELSSGQKSLVNISTTFAFLYLLQIKHSTRLSHLMIDEILDISLGDQVHHVIEYLKEISQDKNITIISHSTTLPLELFNKTIIVGKDGPFSTYDVEVL